MSSPVGGASLDWAKEGSGFKVQGCGGGFAANIYGAMPEGRREEVRCLMSNV